MPHHADARSLRVTRSRARSVVEQCVHGGSMRAVTAGLPSFRFHPDPLQSGVVERSPAACRCCGQRRGFVYLGGTYGEMDLTGALCPWCIADGSAHARFGVTFQDADLPSDQPPEVLAELEERTPGLVSCNPVTWPVCCGAPMAYLEPAGAGELRSRHPGLAEALPQRLAAEHSLSNAEARELFDALDRDEPPCAHVFRCSACGALCARLDRA